MMDSADRECYNHQDWTFRKLELIHGVVQKTEVDYFQALLPDKLRLSEHAPKES